jgi:hypothetical protein
MCFPTTILAPLLWILWSVLGALAALFLGPAPLTAWCLGASPALLLFALHYALLAPLAALLASLAALLFAPNWLCYLVADLIHVLTPVLWLGQAVVLLAAVTQLSAHWAAKIRETRAQHSSLALLLLIASLVCYVLVAALATSLFNQSLTVSEATCLGILLTCVTGVTALAVLLDNGVITDAAYLALYLVHVMYLAVIEHHAPAARDHSAWHVIAALFSTPVQSTNTVAWLLATLFALLTLITVPLALVDDVTDAQHATRAWTASPLFRGVTSQFAVLQYCQALLSGIGAAQPHSVQWRVLQGVVPLALYLGYLLRANMASQSGARAR